MDLAAHQRALLALIDNSVSMAPADDRDAYINQVAGSHALRVLRDIVASWEAYDVRRSCPLTAIALSRSGRLEEAVRNVSFVASSAFLESRAMLFLDEIGRDGDALIAAVARFEHALMSVRSGDKSRHVIEWNRDPGVIINGLLEGRWLADDAPPGRYVTVIAGDLPDPVIEMFEQPRPSATGNAKPGQPTFASPTPFLGATLDRR
jgi:hypothetical protein